MNKMTNKNKTRPPKLTKDLCQESSNSAQLPSFSDKVFKSEHHFHFVTVLKQAGLPLIPNFSLQHLFNSVLVL